jgi:hypothetical protein
LGLASVTDAGGFDYVSCARRLSKIGYGINLSRTLSAGASPEFSSSSRRIWKPIVVTIKPRKTIEGRLGTKRPKAWGFDFRKFASIRSPTGPKEPSSNLGDA